MMTNEDKRNRWHLSKQKHNPVESMSSETTMEGWVEGSHKVAGGRSNYGNTLFYTVCPNDAIAVLLMKKGTTGYWFKKQLVPGGQKLNTAGEYVIPGGAEDHHMTVAGLIKEELKGETGILLNSHCGAYTADIAKFRVVGRHQKLYVAFVRLGNIEFKNVRDQIKDNLRRNGLYRAQFLKTPKKMDLQPGTEDDELVECIQVDLAQARTMACSWHNEILNYFHHHRNIVLGIPTLVEDVPTHPSNDASNVIRVDVSDAQSEAGLPCHEVVSAVTIAGTGEVPLPTLPQHESILTATGMSLRSTELIS